MRVSDYSNEAANKLLESVPSTRDTVNRIVAALKEHDWQYRDDIPRAEQIRTLIGDLDLSDGWHVNKRFDGNRLPADLGVFVTADFQSVNNENVECVYTLEVLGDNKQALPANLLKFQLANDLDPSDRPHLGVAIAFSEDHRLRGKGGNTSGVAWADLYESALRLIYPGVIKTPLVLLKVGL